MSIYATYGRYLRPPHRIAESAFAVAVGDSLIAALAGIAIFTAVFSFSMDPAEGPELAFVTLPQIFLAMPGGRVVAVAFFALLAAGAVISMVSILEVPVERLESPGGRSRARTAVLCTAASLAIGIPSTLGFGVLDGRSLSWAPQAATSTISPCCAAATPPDGRSRSPPRRSPASRGGRRWRAALGLRFRLARAAKPRLTPGVRQGKPRGAHRWQTGQKKVDLPARTLRRTTAPLRPQGQGFPSRP